MLRRYNREVIVAFDADTAGQKAIVRSLKLLEEAKVPVRVLLIPDGKDPDEFVRVHGADALKREIDKSLSVLQYQIHLARKNSYQGENFDPILFQESVFQVLYPLDNHVLIENTLKDLSLELSCSLGSLQETFKARRPIRQQTPDAVLALETPMVDTTPHIEVPGETRELRYLAIYMQHPEWKKDLRHPLQPKHFRRPELGEFYRLVLENEKEEGCFADYFTLLDQIPAFPPQLRQNLAAWAMTPECEQADLRVLDELGLLILQEYAREKMSVCSQQLTLPDVDKNSILLEIAKWDRVLYSYRMELERGYLHE